MVGALGYTSAFLIWLFVIISRLRRKEEVPQLMYAFTFGAFIFSVICIVLAFRYSEAVKVAQWLFSLTGIGFLILTIKKVKR